MGETMAFITFRDVAMSIRMTADAGNRPVFAGIDGHLLVHILVTGTAIFRKNRVPIAYFQWHMGLVAYRAAVIFHCI